MFGWVLNMPQFIIGSSGTVAKFRTLINSHCFIIFQKKVMKANSGLNFSCCENAVREPGD